MAGEEKVLAWHFLADDGNEQLAAALAAARAAVGV